METIDFLNSVISTGEGYFCLAHAKMQKTDEETTKTWREEFFEWPKCAPDIINRIAQLSEDNYDVYFSPHLFSQASSKKEYVLETHTMCVDLDEANILTLSRIPTVLVETSPDRHQGYWIIKEKLDTEEFERLSKRLTYSISRCDKSGWTLGHKFRVPGTFNHKYDTGSKIVRVAEVSGKIYTKAAIDELPSIEELLGSEAIKYENEPLDWVEGALNTQIGPRELLARVRSALPARIVAQYDIVAPDRSVALWALMNASFRAALSREEVFWLAYHSANNKFRELRHGGVKELAKDVIRAEIEFKTKIPDVKGQIARARRNPGIPSEKNAYIVSLVMEQLLKMGEFHHTDDDGYWYIRRDTGKPVMLGMRNQSISVMIESLFGINGSEKESQYVNHALATYTSELPATSQIAVLSHYDADTKTFMLHTGRRDVMVVTKDAIKKVDNGYMGVVFNWGVGDGSMEPKYQLLQRPWIDELLEGCLSNIIGMDVESAKAVLRIWFIMLLLRNGVSNKPILAFFGAPGSGKSTLFRRIYAMLYGKGKAVSGITNESDFDYAVAKDPLVVLDNVDTWAKWLPDRMALSAAESQITKRRLFTDTDTVTFKRQALLGITAHNPKFGREDVMDRMLIFTFERLRHFVSETIIINRILELRNAMWGSVLQDLQRVFSTEMPTAGWPQFRVEDFAVFGYWVATALGIQEPFCRGITIIQSAQKTFVLEEDGILRDAIMKYIERDGSKSEEYKTAGQLFHTLETLSGDPNAFRRRYSNAVALGKKFLTLQDSLQTLIEVDFKYDTTKGARVWSFKRRVEDKVTTNGTHKYFDE